MHLYLRLPSSGNGEAPNKGLLWNCTYQLLHVPPAPFKSSESLSARRIQAATARSYHRLSIRGTRSELDIRSTDFLPLSTEFRLPPLPTELPRLCWKLPSFVRSELA
jgi:hypothetical protein